MIIESCTYNNEINLPYKIIYLEKAYISCIYTQNINIQGVPKREGRTFPTGTSFLGHLVIVVVISNRINFTIKFESIHEYEK